MNKLISSSILSADFGHLADQIQEVLDNGVNWIHVDVMDGHFAPNITMGPFIVETVRRYTDAPIDVHLMIEKPEQYIQVFADAGASNLSVHIEGNPHVYKTLESIQQMKCHPGIVVNPGTSIDLISPVLPLVDLVLIMTVNPGFSGQRFIPAMLPKIRAARQLIDSSPAPIWLEVDGGITADTLPLVNEAGADVFVSASAIFHHAGGIAAGIQALKACIDD